MPWIDGHQANANLGRGSVATNKLSHSKSYQRKSSSYTELAVAAERELSAFFNAVEELFGPKQARFAAKYWLQQLASIPDLPTSPRNWRLITIEASERLAKRGFPRDPRLQVHG